MELESQPNIILILETPGNFCMFYFFGFLPQAGDMRPPRRQVPKKRPVFGRGGKNRVKKRLFGNISKLVENQRRNMFDKNKPLGTPQ